MALGNWDEFALNKDGNIISGSMVSPSGIRAEIYKNWLYLYDSKYWRKDFGYSAPCIGEIQHGNIRIGDIRIIAERNDSQESIFVIVQTGYFRIPDTNYNMFVGIGSYGYEGKTWVGIKESTKQQFLAFICKQKWELPEKTIEKYKEVI